MKKDEQDSGGPRGFSAAQQGWFSLAAWMAFGLLLEGLIGFRSPALLQDELRRDLFRLAHAHGAALNLVLLLADVYGRYLGSSAPGLGMLSLRAGVIAMPVGFLLGGIWHYESDPGIGIFLAPIGGVLVIFGVIATALSMRRG